MAEGNRREASMAWLRESRTFHTLLLGMALALTALIAAGDEPTPTPTPAPTPSPTAGSETAAGEQAAAKGEPPRNTPGIVISDQNLAELAAKGHLTMVTGTGAAQGDAGAAPGPPPANPSEERAREYWRGRYAEQKALIQSLKSEIADLDVRIPGLWNQFYTWDDPVYRDGVIKPDLDAAINKRKELEQRLVTEEPKLNGILSEARQAGALPGWFRDLQ